MRFALIYAEPQLVTFFNCKLRPNDLRIAMYFIERANKLCKVLDVAPIVD